MSTIDKLNLAINDVRSWMIKSKLKINDDKSEFIVLIQPYKQGNVKDLQLQIGQCSVATSSQAKNLGVIFDCGLTMEKQISSVCRSLFFHLWNIGSVRRYLTDSSTAQLIHSLVTTRVDYCNALLYGLPATRIKKLQRVQNARILTLTPKIAHITPVLYDLRWLPVKARILFKVLVFAFKSYYRTASGFFCNLVYPAVTISPFL